MHSTFSPFYLLEASPLFIVMINASVTTFGAALDVPHLEARIDFEPASKRLSINLHPSQENMNRAFKDLMSFLNWTKVAIIYEEDYGNCTEKVKQK